MEVKQVRTEQWSIKVLCQKVKIKQISKPKYQRKRKWDIMECKSKEGVPNMKNYILFLADTCNSVHSITFSTLDKINYSNTDGNNRINALVCFIDTPFKIFPEYLTDIFNFIDNNLYLIDYNDKQTIKNIVKEMTYDNVITFKYQNFFKEKGLDVLYQGYLKAVRDEFEILFEKLQDKLKIKGRNIDDTVQLNVNIFEGYTITEMAKIFNDINKYSSNLTYMEIAASVLYNITEFKINDEILSLEIHKCIEDFYKERSIDEVLPCYQYDKEKDKMNAFDFIVGFQNYANKQNEFINKCDNENILFLKVWKLLYEEHDYTTETVNQFINYIQNSIHILNELKIDFFSKLVKKSKNINNDTLYKKIIKLGENIKFIIIVTIIGFIKQDINSTIILKSIRKALIYTIFINDLNKDNKDKYKIDDRLHFEAGGAYVTNKAREYLKNPYSITNNINRELMKQLIQDLILDNIKAKTFGLRENGKNKSNDKRRDRKIFENVLIQSYFKSKVPTSYLNEEYSLEHIIPFSSGWKDNINIDIDRLGNVIPIINMINLKRSNNHISSYKSIDKSGFLRYLEDIIPSDNEYNEIVSHEYKKPYIINSDKFNEKCINNENILINNFLDEICK